jgi:hypothetical protein
MWYTSSNGKIELQITKEQASIGYHQGQCDDGIAYLRTVPAIKRQLAKLDQVIVAMELNEYGAWESEQLVDCEENLNRILWIACGDIVENINQGTHHE